MREPVRSWPQINVRFEKEVYKRIEELAIKWELSKNDVIRIAVKEFLERIDNQQKSGCPEVRSIIK